MIDTSGQVIAAFSLIAFFLLIPPFFYHCRNKNIPACSLIFWLCYGNLTGFINAIIWSGENFAEVTEAKGYCDVTSRIGTASTSGVLCSIAALIFNLYMIIAAKNHLFLAKGSRRRLCTNLAMCWLTPVMIMGTSYIVQSERYVILRYLGCAAVFSLSYVTLLLVSMWVFIWSAVAFVFALLTVITYLKKRHDISDILRCTNSGLNLRRFARLLIFGLLIMFVMAPYSIVRLVSDIRTYGLSGFSWSEIHNANWNDIYAYDLGFWSRMTSRVIQIVLSVITFLLFGMGTDALDMYRTFFCACGITYFGKASPDEISITKEFAESRNPSRKSEYSGETAVNMGEFANFKELMEDAPFSAHLTPSLSKDSPIETNYTSIDGSDVLSFNHDLECGPDLGFAFRVAHK